MSLLILDPEQKQFFDDNGYLLLKGFYGPAEMEQMRGEFHRLVTEIEDRPKNVRYSFMDAPEGYAPDPFNPRNVVWPDGSDVGWRLLVRPVYRAAHRLGHGRSFGPGPRFPQRQNPQ